MTKQREFQGSVADRRQLAKIQAAIDAHEAGLTPSERARQKKQLAYFAKSEAASVDHMKNVLRRLGVESNLDNHREWWVQIRAAAGYVGVSKEQFLSMTPRELFAILELKARNLELSRAATNQRAASLREVRSAWVNRKLREAGTTITKLRSPSFRAIKTYMSGTTTKRTPQVREAFKNAFHCSITEVPL
jgi:hypothetical protein